MTQRVSMGLLNRLILVFVFSALLIPALCQNTQPSSRSPGASASASVPAKQQESETSAEILKQEEKQRALGVVPLFGMTSVHNAPPLTSRQKFQLMLKSELDPFTFVDAGITAGVGQATDEFAPYGQGAAGFGKRYGAALADGADSAFFGNFVYPVLFKEDPRYFRLGEGRIGKRLFYALEQVVVTRTDSGGQSFNFSNVLGTLTAGTISNAYYPAEDRGVGLTASRAAIQLGYGSLGNVFLEFWPDIDRKLFHRRQRQARDEQPASSPKTPAPAASQVTQTHER